MMNTDSDQTAGEAALQVGELVRRWQQLKAAGEDMSAVEQQIKPYKIKYVRAGAKYGGNHTGMMQWFDERAQESAAV